MITPDLPTWSYIVLVPLVVWSLFWKGMALWHAARQSSKVWFVVLLLINTAGILDIIYLLMSGRLKLNGSSESTSRQDQPES